MHPTSDSAASASLFSTRMLSERKTSKTGFRPTMKKLPYLRRVINLKRLKTSQVKMKKLKAKVTSQLMIEVLTGFNTHARSSKVS